MAQLAARQIVALEVLGSKPSGVKPFFLLAFALAVTGGFDYE